MFSWTSKCDIFLFKIIWLNKSNLWKSDSTIILKGKDKSIIFFFFNGLIHGGVKPHGALPLLTASRVYQVRPLDLFLTPYIRSCLELKFLTTLPRRKWWRLLNNHRDPFIRQRCIIGAVSISASEGCELRRRAVMREVDWPLEMALRRCYYWSTAANLVIYFSRPSRSP